MTFAEVLGTSEAFSLKLDVLQSLHFVGIDYYDTAFVAKNKDVSWVTFESLDCQRLQVMFFKELLGADADTPTIISIPIPQSSIRMQRAHPEHTAIQYHGGRAPHHTVTQQWTAPLAFP